MRPEQGVLVASQRRPFTIEASSIPMATILGSSAEEIAVLCKQTPYLVERFLGRGSMGEVWVVRHDFLGSKFALKVLHPRFCDQQRFVDRMRQEAQIAASLDHPNIVPVIDFWVTIEGRPCLVMEFLTGKTLKQELKEKYRLPQYEVIELGCQLLSAVAAAHQRGILHRDIKPDNIFLHELPGRTRTARLLDFGVARVQRENTDHPIAELAEPTRTGAVIGSPGFMSPEAQRGERLDERADVYSVGVTLYQALTSQWPFDFTSKTPLPPSHLVHGVTPELDALLTRALAPDKDNRIQSAPEFESRLRKMRPSRS